MSPLPEQMRDRWRDRAEAAPGEGTIYWHVLLRDNAQVRAKVREAQQQLSDFSGLHLTPEKWIHLTVLRVGSTTRISPDQTSAMVDAARRSLADVHPIPVTLGRILYHPEAIMLGVDPEHPMEPILEGVRAATRDATGREGVVNGSFPLWTPHITVAYSTGDQPAGPIIASLGKDIPACTVHIDAVSLVIQWGPELLWEWEPIDTVRLTDEPEPQ